MDQCSSIVGDPAYLGYHLSKLNLHRAFRVFSRRDSLNRFKTVILGPVDTSMVKMSQVSSLRKYVSQILTVSVDQVSEAIVSFANGRRKTLRYPLVAVLIYQLLRLCLTVFPRLYFGTQN